MLLVMFSFLGPGRCGHHTCHNYSICDPVTNNCFCKETFNPIHSPVCGTDQKTYSNIYVLEASACHENLSVQFLHNGVCKKGD